jgi:hypothetical protein
MALLLLFLENRSASGLKAISIARPWADETRLRPFFWMTIHEKARFEKALESMNRK